MQSLKDEYILMRRYKVNRVTNLRGGFFKTMEKRSVCMGARGGAEPIWGTCDSYVCPEC